MTPKEALDIIKSNYTDEHGHIVQLNRDSGDTASREGVCALLVKYNNLEDWGHNFNKVLNQLEIEPGLYIRHGFPKPTDQEYVGDPKRFSRDQQTPLELAMGEYPEQKERLERLYKAHESRWWKYQNADWWIGSYGRPLFKGEAKLRLLIEDTALVVNSLLAVYRRIKDKYAKIPDTSNDVIHALTIIYCNRNSPTLLSKLATKIYKYTNPQKALDFYFSHTSGAPPLNELYRVPLQEALK